MIRFTKLGEISSGIPYVNSDFTVVLQNEQIKAYSSILDGINFGSTSSGEPKNDGIILSGCEILSANGSSFDMGFTSSVVYIGGEFYESNPNLTGTVNIPNATFYLIPGPTATELRTLKTDLVTTSTASHTRYFTYSTTLPTTSHIKFSNSGTSRYYKRILKYFTSRVGDIYMTKSKLNFDVNGVGFNDMEGFVILDSNSGISGYPDLSGKFLRGQNVSGYSTTQFVGGSHSHRISGVELAVHSHSLTQTWEGDLSRPADFRHFHYINRGYFGPPNVPDLSDGKIEDQNDPDPFSGRLPSGWRSPIYPETPDTETLGMSAINVNELTGSIFGISKPTNTSKQDEIDIQNPKLTGGIHDRENSGLQTHRHSLTQSDFGDGNPNNSGLEHENRPPYFVVVYYTKKTN